MQMYVISQKLLLKQNQFFSPSFGLDTEKYGFSVATRETPSHCHFIHNNSTLWKDTSLTLLACRSTSVAC